MPVVNTRRFGADKTVSDVVGRERRGVVPVERWAIEKGRQPFAGEPDLSPFMRQFEVSRGGTDYAKLYKAKN